MKMDIVASSGNDEFYTPLYAIEPIKKYIKIGGASIWCPFDTKDSLFVKELGKTNKVIATHIKDGYDFFNYEPSEHYDYIISNPPYSCKGEVFERLFKLDKPFAMLVGVVGIFESQKRFEMFRDNEFEIMYFNKRISYFKNYEDQKPSLNPPFGSVYICHRMLPKTIMFEEVNKNYKL